MLTPRVLFRCFSFFIFIFVHSSLALCVWSSLTLFHFFIPSIFFNFVLYNFVVFVNNFYVPVSHGFSPENWERTATVQASVPIYIQQKKTLCSTRQCKWRRSEPRSSKFMLAIYQLWIRRRVVRVICLFYFLSLFRFRCEDLVLLLRCPRAIWLIRMWGICLLSGWIKYSTKRKLDI